jgi:hypothetical protein
MTEKPYALVLASEHKQGLHEDTPHKMCRQCHPAEAELLDGLEERLPNVHIEVDAHAVNVRWTDKEPDGEHVFATLEEAKARAIRTAITERNAWMQCVRDAQALTMDDIAPSWD